MDRFSMRPKTISLINCVLRGFQLVTSAVALATCASSFDTTYSNGFSYRLGSHATSFELIASYNSMLYAAWFFVCVELLGLATRPRVPMMRLLDGANAVVLVVSGSVLQASDYVKHCDIYGFMVKCNGFERSVAFTFATAVLFAASVGLTFAKCSDQTEEDMGYVVETTPTAAGGPSPRAVPNAPPTPSFKV